MLVFSLCVLASLENVLICYFAHIFTWVFNRVDISVRLHSILPVFPFTCFAKYFLPPFKQYPASQIITSKHMMWFWLYILLISHFSLLLLIHIMMCFSELFYSYVHMHSVLKITGVLSIYVIENGLEFLHFCSNKQDWKEVIHNGIHIVFTCIPCIFAFWMLLAVRNRYYKHANNVK